MPSIRINWDSLLRRTAMEEQKPASSNSEYGRPSEKVLTNQKSVVNSVAVIRLIYFLSGIKKISCAIKKEKEESHIGPVSATFHPSSRRRQMWAVQMALKEGSGCLHNNIVVITFSYSLSIPHNIKAPVEFSEPMTFEAHPMAHGRL